MQKIEINMLGTHTVVLLNNEKINVCDVDIESITVKKEDNGETIILFQAKQ